MSKSQEDKIHALWHKFAKKFMDQNERFHLSGYELITEVEKFTKRYPQIQTIRCDDRYFASSDLVLIPHENDTEYMGTTVVYIPQCAPDSPTTFFLYPNHVDYLLKGLKVVQKNSKKKPGRVQKLLNSLRRRKKKNGT